MISHSLARPSLDYLHEMGRIRRHNSRALTWSVVAHLVLIVWMLLQHTFSNEPAPLVEISWLEAEPASAAPSPAQTKSVPEPKQEKTLTPSDESQKFQRLTRQADLEPEPQRPDAVDDRLARSLDALQSTLKSSRPNLAVTQTESKIDSPPSMASVSSPMPTGLVRDDTPRSSALSVPKELSRSTSTSKPTLAVAPKPDVQERAPAMATPDENSARKTLDGAQLVGPVADRPVDSYKLPVYPAWAMRDAVEGSVTLYFIVLANGTVKNNILVQKTSGHRDFDENAKAALRAWKFKALSGAGEQWGTITFHFKLRDS